MAFGVTVKYLPTMPVKGYALSCRGTWSWDGHDFGQFRRMQERSRRASIGGHAVYSDRQNGLIQALLDYQDVVTEYERETAKLGSRWSHLVKRGSTYLRRKAHAAGKRKREEGGEAQLQ